ncbi:AGAP002013-PA [Anopheles gambiae str. PEST]|uniref:Dynein axonemal assembly factor 1 homolog n=1 Tax=Anopheles gambiae TaxID=7165 RepID=Q7PYM5_ANOGA|nr:AGAP002013-PA [Anopheles gambiae str. PEST]
MSTSKMRGKSALHINDGIIGTGAPTAGVVTGGGSGPPAALLKIESVVPKLSSRVANGPASSLALAAAGHSTRLRTFHRSHSTLSSSYLRKVTAAAAADYNRQQRIHPTGGATIRPEPICERGGYGGPSPPPPPAGAVAAASQSTHDTTGHHALLAGYAETPPLDSTLIVQNGVPSIRRSEKDREKHPDRVNLDRKGLSSIPLIEDEPNLRLLSLQHNLINAFHIPPEADPNNNLPTTRGQHQGAVVSNGELKPATAHYYPAAVSSSPPTPTKPSPSGTPTNGPAFSSSSSTAYGPAATKPSAKQFLRQKSTSRGQLLMGTNLASLAGPGGNGNSVASSFIQSRITIGSKQPAVPNGAPQSTGPMSGVSPHLQKPPATAASTGNGSTGPIAITAHQKSLLKKSNSFIGGPSMFLTGGPGATQPATPNGATTTTTTSNGMLKMRAGKLLLVPSFSIDNLSNIAELPAGGAGLGEQDYFNGQSSSNGSAGNSGKTTPTSTGPPVVPPGAESVVPPAFVTRYNLSNLVFLDLYDNQIEKISCLDGLKSLTVLLLGKNRITDIGGLVSLKSTLRVLDLHGNKISNISGKICQLQELKSLNLAGNALRQIQTHDFAGLFSLKELNLKRNRIKKLFGFDDLHHLERLWLCHNDLQCVEDMAAIAKAINLKEVTIENNPVSLAGDCVSFLVSYLPGLVSLSQMQITEQVRRAASAWRRNKELSDSKYSNLSSDVCQSMRREEIISNARTNWELLRSQQSMAIARGTQRPAAAGGKEVAKEPDGGMLLGDGAILPPGDQGVPSAVEKPTKKGANGASSQGTRPLRPANGKKMPSNRKPLVRSSSQDNSSSQVSEQGGEDYFRLPPILAPFLEQSAPAGGKGAGEGEASVTSGVGTHADSSVSSGFSSENEEQMNLEKEMEKQSTLVASGSANSTPEKETDRPDGVVAAPGRALDVVEDPSSSGDPVAPRDLPVPEENGAPPREKLKLPAASDDCQPPISMADPCPPPDLDANLDKLSTLSTVSTKSATESVITNASSNSCNSDSTGSNTDSAGSSSAGGSGSAGAASGSSSTSGPTPSLTAERGRTHKTKLTTPIKRYGTGTLARTQTARNASTLPSGGTTSLANSSNLAHGNAGTGAPPANAPSGTYAGIPSSNYGPPSGASGGTGRSGKSGEREREQGGDYLIEICGRYLNVYGLGALRFIDKQWNMQKACDVHTVKFSYINFNSITAILCRIKVRFVNAENFIFRETNIACLGQINALAESQGIASLTIDPEGNPLAGRPWRSYAIYRLSHWGLKQVNGAEVTPEEVQQAEATYAGLSDLVLWSLPEGLLQPLLQRLRLEETAHASKMTAKEWLMQADPSLKNIVGKEALQWKKHSTAQDDTAMRAKGRAYFGRMLENTCNAVEKLQRLETMWPVLLLEMIRNTLIDYSQIDVYVKGMLVDLLK